ncbi:sce7725 family protein [Pseudomonas sp. PONIH3]|jgi:hypothetical protein|uniref:sce7725 family protein n=1 Tax=Pseudomonas sp. PONIH3 TaxID=1636610 RepID=UPI00131A0F1F|nr:sce7725 family protein [Pseudomonas sp. PONIH3]
MYFPILKGKQHELAALKGLIGHIDVGNVCPILEPVNTDLHALASSISALSSSGYELWVVINPSQGKYSGYPRQNIHVALSKLLATLPSGGRFLPCVKVNGAGDLFAINLLGSIQQPFVAYVEGVIDAALALELKRASVVALNSDLNSSSTWAGFSAVVLFHDGFEKKSRNLDYPIESFYSRLHLNYKLSPSVIGFGDYTVLPERYATGGGPAYVVTIHLSYLSVARNMDMYVRHFSSHTDVKSQVDPGGKFREALLLLVAYCSANPHDFVMTAGLEALYELNRTGHYPGLGVVKEESIKHHIQTLSHF